MKKNIILFSTTSIILTSIGITGCANTSTQPTVTVTAQPTATTQPTTKSTPKIEPSATAAKVSNLPPPPSGATVLQTSDTNGVQYARYSTTEMPNQIAAYYSSGLQKDGYNVTSSGGGGGGYGKYGGADAGVKATKTGSYVNIQAGGSTQGPTYFEVCQGANENAVNECNNSSNSGAS